jgi:carboxypeptidase Taq
MIAKRIILNIQRNFGQHKAIVGTMPALSADRASSVPTKKINDSYQRDAFMGKQYETLLEKLATVDDLRNATSVLSWDQETAMPEGGAEARARQMATLSRLSHEFFIDEQIGALIDGAASEYPDMPYESDEASMLRVVQKDYEELTKVPASYVAEFTKLTSLAHHTWAKAREAQDFSMFVDALKRIVDMVRQQADYLGYDEHPYDALLGQYERGMTTAQVKAIFDNHRPRLVDLISKVGEAQQVDDSVLKKHYPQAQQREFALKMVKHYGFDFSRGIQAVSVHPFCTNFSVNDVRITTRFDENFLNPALFGMMHEAGHAMYEQGIAQNLEGTFLAGGTSLGVHESQSRMWENIVGRSKGFWSWALPQLAKTFPEQLAGVDLDTFYRAINKVERSFIRVEADEATYNLHIILRFEIEQGLLTGEIPVEQVRDAWNDKFTQFFGITPPNDALGVLQDVHWSAGLIGYFPTYALGNLLSVQYYNQAVKDNPSIPDEIAQGKFDTLRTWLNDNIHAHGRKFTGDELTRRITGEGIQSDDYMDYLENKIGGVYGL